MNAGGISTKVTTVAPTKKVPASAVRQFASANARRITKMLTIELTKGHSGLGFSFTTSYNPAGGNSPIYIKDVLPKGAAIEDGRLRPGDRILEVNGTPMTGKNQTNPVAMLCNIPLGKTVQLVVSREGTETVEVDGRLQTNDQLVNINGISLLGMSNRNAMETVRNNIAQYILVGNENGNDPNAQRPEVPHRNNNNTFGYGRKDKLLMPSLEEKKSNYPPTLSSIQGESMIIKGGYNHNVKKTADSNPVTGNAVENLNVVPSGSQLSLDESNPGFVRDGFGQQSMSEKSMHVQLDARRTVYYQCSKKAREEKDKHQQSCKLAYTQEGGTEDNLRISFVTGGAGGISTKVKTASAVRQLASANARRITKMLTIELTKGHSGLGFIITTLDKPAGSNSPIYISHVLQKGAVIEDGRLRAGDRILEVNGTPMTGKNQTDAFAILCNIPLGKTVQLVVSREETETVEEESELVANKIGDALADSHSAGLGVILVEKSTSPANGSVDLGIFIKSIIPGSIAYKDGLLQINDQLVNINGISLLGMSNRNALETLRNAIAQYILVASENGNNPNAQRPEVPHSNDDNNKLQNYKQIALSKMTQMDLDILLPGCNPVIERLMDQGSLERNNNNTYGYGRKDKLLMPSLEEKKSNYPPTLSSIQGERMMIEGGYNHNVKKTADSHPVTGNAVENLNVVPSGSQLSLDESNPGFARDGFGQQSMSEKSMHAQLDARRTGTYQCSKKARVEKDKQSSKLDYTQEDGTEFNPKIISVTGGADGISTKVATVTPTNNVPASAVRQLASTNWRRITKMLTIELTKGHSGLGFNIITLNISAGSNFPICISHVLRKGAAIEDGRLRTGDRILEVNGTPMTGKIPTDAVAILRNTPLGKTVQLVVSRQEVEETETETVEVESEVHWRLQTNNQLVNINGISLLGMSNRNAMETLRNAIAQYILVANENGNDPNDNVKKTADSHPVTGNAVENLNIVPSGSQLSLDESNPGFVREGFGQQSMSEKSMHAQLDARSTGTYQCSKKARVENDKQSSKLDYTQEGGTEFNPKIISVTGGAKGFLGYPKDPINVASCTMTEIQLPTKRLERQKCATCDFQSFDRKGFKEHLVIHKKSKNTYQCQECGLCFVTELSLGKHLLIIHKIRDTKKYLEDEGSNFMPDTEETEVYCHVCFQTFTKGIALKAHQRSHGM